VSVLLAVLTLGMTVLAGLRLRRLLVLVKSAPSATREDRNSRDRSLAKLDISLAAISFVTMSLLVLMAFLYLVTGTVPTPLKVTWVLLAAVFITGSVAYVWAWNRATR